MELEGSPFYADPVLRKDSDEEDILVKGTGQTALKVSDIMCCNICCTLLCQLSYRISVSFNVCLYVLSTKLRYKDANIIAAF